MDLYLLRHARAERAGPDGDEATRPLAEKGQRDARRLGRWIRERELAFDLVATSPHARARETAVLVLQSTDAPPPLEAWDELGPEGTVEAVLARLAALDPAGAVLLVGHKALLSALASAGIGGGRVRLAVGSLARVRRFAPESGGELEWLVTPAVIAPRP
ncbi:MAG: phosphohistidine phosphatase SixA [Methanospirillum sp.]